MPIFVGNNLFPIDVKYIEVKMKNGAEGIHIIEDEKDIVKYGDRVKTFQTKWVQPNWKENNDAIRSASQIDPVTGSKGVDINSYRCIVLEKFMKAWEASDETGNPVPLNKENINKLDFNIARSLADDFIHRNIPTEEELGN